jgi:hypothetical protein
LFTCTPACAPQGQYCGFGVNCCSGSVCVALEEGSGAGVCL